MDRNARAIILLQQESLRKYYGMIEKTVITIVDLLLDDNKFCFYIQYYEPHSKLIDEYYYDFYYDHIYINIICYDNSKMKFAGYDNVNTIVVTNVLDDDGDFSYDDEIICITYHQCYMYFDEFHGHHTVNRQYMLESLEKIIELLPKCAIVRK